MSKFKFAVIKNGLSGVDCDQPILRESVGVLLSFAEYATLGESSPFFSYSFVSPFVHETRLSAVSTEQRTAVILINGDLLDVRCFSCFFIDNKDTSLHFAPRVGICKSHGHICFKLFYNAFGRDSENGINCARHS